MFADFLECPTQHIVLLYEYLLHLVDSSEGLLPELIQTIFVLLNPNQDLLYHLVMLPLRRLEMLILLN